MAARPAYSPWAPLQDKANTHGGGWSRTKSVPELFLTSARFKDQRAHITKRGETGEMRRLRRISPCCCGIITADMRLISGDRRRWGASASACSGILGGAACSIQFSYCGRIVVFLFSDQSFNWIKSNRSDHV